MPKTWKEKLLFSKNLPCVFKVKKAMLGAKVGDKMVIPLPTEYDEQMRKIPFGEVKTVPELREFFAKKYKADITCPLTAGIFVNVVAHAAEEAALADAKDTTPWWRTVKKDGELNEKYPGGIEGHAQRLSLEGHRIVKKGKRVFVDLASTRT